MTGAEPDVPYPQHAIIFRAVNPAFADSEIVIGQPVGTDGDVAEALAGDDSETFVRFDVSAPATPGNHIGQPEALYSLMTLGKEDPLDPIDPSITQFTMGMAVRPSPYGGRVTINLVDLTDTNGLVGQSIDQFEGDTYEPIYVNWSTGPEDGTTRVIPEDAMASYVALYNAGNLGVRIICELGFNATTSTTVDYIDLAYFGLYWGGAAEEIFTPAYIDAAIDAELLDTGVIFRNG